VSVANSPSQTLDQSGTGGLRFTSDLAMTGNYARTLLLRGSTSGTGEFAGNISNFASSNLTTVTKNGTGTWTLSGNNTYTGATNLEGGLLIVGSSNGISGGLGSSGTSFIEVRSGILGLTEASGNLTRVAGGSANNIRLSQSVLSDRGFAAFGVNRSVNMGNMVLGGTSTSNINGGLILGHSTADATLTFGSALSVTVNATQSIIVNNGSAAIDGIISGIAIGFDWDQGSVPRGRFPNGLRVKYVPDRSELMLPIDFYRFQALDLLDGSRWPEGYRKLADGSFFSVKQEKAVEIEGLYSLLGQKFEAWKHEQERRFIYDHQIAEDDLPFSGTDSEGWGRRVVHFQPENVTEIVFGYRCTDEEIQSCEGVLKKYPHAKLRYVDFHPTEYKVRLHEGCWEQILTTHAMRFTSFRSVKKREPEEA
jgi:autotransporter-associated beta strand protein